MAKFTTQQKRKRINFLFSFLKKYNHIATSKCCIYQLNLRSDIIRYFQYANARCNSNFYSQLKKNPQINVENGIYMHILQNETVWVKNRLIQPAIKNSYKNKNAHNGFLKSCYKRFLLSKKNVNENIRDFSVPSNILLLFLN